MTAVRISGLSASVVDLFSDEAQYWSWAQHLSFGYYTKPPLIAWTIFIAEQVCGSDEWCVRAPAPIFYFATCLAVYAIGRTLYDERVGFWAALLLALTTGTAFSARIISTDVPLLFFWAVALLAYVKLLAELRWRYAILLGAAIGFGLLSKYAMLYFLPGLLIAALASPRARLMLTAPHLWIALAIAALVIAPNLAWNLAHGFVTFTHTGGLVLNEQRPWSALRGIEFLAVQFAVIGPIIFATMLLVTAQLVRGRLTERDRIMIAFSIAPILIVIAFSTAAKVPPNWAAPAFISGVVVVAATLVRNDAWTWLKASVAIGIAAQLMLLITDIVPERVSLPFLKGPSPYARTLGWREYAAAADALARQVGARAIVNDSRLQYAPLVYYLRKQPVPVLSWRAAGGPNIDLGTPLTEDVPGPLLFVGHCPNGERFRTAFAEVDPLGAMSAGTGIRQRAFLAFKLDRAKGPIQPLPRCS